MIRATTLSVAGVLAITAACSGFRPHARTSSAAGGRVFRGGGSQDPTASGDMGGSRGLPSARPGTATQTATAGADARQVCRNGSRPDGWIAVAYVAGGLGCATRASADSAHSVAVLAHYAILPASTVLEVCADEPIPHDWVRDTPAEPSDACPGLKGNPASTTQRIRRLR